MIERMLAVEIFPKSLEKSLPTSGMKLYMQLLLVGVVSLCVDPDDVDSSLVPGDRPTDKSLEKHRREDESTSPLLSLFGRASIRYLRDQCALVHVSDDFGCFQCETAVTCKIEHALTGQEGRTEDGCITFTRLLIDTCISGSVDLPCTEGMR